MNKHKNRFINVGLEKILWQQDIIGIFDLDSITVKKDSREFVSKAQKKDQIEDRTTDLPVSVILCSHKEKKQNLILSSFSLSALYSRMTKRFP